MEVLMTCHILRVLVALWTKNDFVFDLAEFFQTFSHYSKDNFEGVNDIT